ncbi:formylglycine-generating enzyme family protein [Planctomycetota bacterium]
MKHLTLSSVISVLVILFAGCSMPCFYQAGKSIEQCERDLLECVYSDRPTCSCMQERGYQFLAANTLPQSRKRKKIVVLFQESAGSGVRKSRLEEYWLVDGRDMSFDNFKLVSDPGQTTDPNAPPRKLIGYRVRQDNFGKFTPKEKTIDMGNGVIMEFVLIPAGKFEMGSPSTESDRGNNEGPVHWVIISRPFYMGKYEVTQEQYYVVAKYKPSRFKQEGRPVENVSWDQADRFCRKLSEMKGGTYRLPTEAEWEYACRAGSQGIFCFGGGITYSQIEQYAWYSKNSDSATHPVGEKKPNSFGLYDMHGNVWEWCGDWYADNYYNHGVMIDPPGPQNGKSRVLRGGSWLYGARYCRSANRIDLDPYYIRNHVGFRVVLEIE